MKLKVAEAIEEDVNKGFARIDEGSYGELGINQGDFIEIIGSRNTVARVEKGYPGDEGLGIIRIDGATRKNAGTGIREYVEIRRAEVKDAEEVLLRPAGRMLNISITPERMKKYLLGMVTMKDNIIKLKSYEPARTDVFELIGKDFVSFEGLAFKVWDGAPSGPIRITEDTEIVLDTDCNEIETLKWENEMLKKKMQELEHKLSPVINQQRAEMHEMLRHREAIQDNLSCAIKMMQAGMDMIAKDIEKRV